MLYNVHSKSPMCTQDERTFSVHLDLCVTIRFDSSLNPTELQHVQQSTLQQIRNSLNSQNSTGGVTQPSATSQPIPRKAIKSVAARDNNAHKTIAPVETVEDNGNVPQNAVSAASGPRDETINNDSYTHDSKLAQKLCLALSQAAAQIKKEGVPGWWSDVEELKPTCNTLHDANGALYAKKLDQVCAQYETSLRHRASMTRLIRCFLDMIRRAFHRKSRANAKKYVSDKADREQRYRVGELMIAITKPILARHGKKAYTLYALMAALETFDPKAGYWRRYRKARMRRLASQIAAILLTPEYEHIWRDVDMKLAFDPAEFFATTGSFGGTSSSSANLSYNHIQETLGLIDKASQSEKDDMPLGPTFPAIQAQATRAHCGNIEPSMMSAPYSQWTPYWSNTMPSLPSVDIGNQTAPNAVPCGDPTWSATGLETLPPLDLDSFNTLCGEVELCAMPDMTPLWPPGGDGSISASSENWQSLSGEMEISTM